jgi:hypothetical protein
MVITAAVLVELVIPRVLGKEFRLEPILICHLMFSIFTSVELRRKGLWFSLKYIKARWARCLYTTGTLAAGLLIGAAIIHLFNGADRTRPQGAATKLFDYTPKALLQTGIDTLANYVWPPVATPHQKPYWQW